MAQANVTTQHPEYTKALGPWWLKCRDLIEGADKVKAGSPFTGGITNQAAAGMPEATRPAGSSPSSPVGLYLPTPPGMTEQDFAFYRARALFYNAMARTVTALAGAVMQKAPDVEAPASLEYQLEDLTLLDEPLDVVAQRILTEVLSVGRYVLFLDMPPVEEVAAVALPEGRKRVARPYWVTLDAERVINWKTAKVGDDPDQLVLVIIREDVPVPDGGEFSHQTQVQYKELALVEGDYQTRTWVAADKEAKTYAAGPWMRPMRRGTPLDFIPLMFLGPEGITPCVAKPPLLDLADVNISHFRNSADHEQGLFMTAIPIPVVIGMGQSDAPLKVGGSMAWRVPQGGDAKMLEFSGAGLASIREAMASKERLMATLGARLLEDPTAQAAETATAVRMRHSGEGAALRTITGIVSTAMTTMLRWHAWWFAGTGDLEAFKDVSVTLATEFVQAKATPEEVKTALLLLQDERISFDTFYARLEGWTREGVSPEDELAAIEREGGPPKDLPADPPEPVPPPQPPPVPPVEPPAA